MANKIVPTGRILFPTLFSKTPFSEFDYFHNQALNMFDDIMNDFFYFPQKARDTFKNKLQYPKTDVYIDQDNFLTYEMSVPGLSKEDINIEYEKGILKVEYNKTETAKNEEDWKRYIIKELKHSSFTRQWEIPEEAVLETDERKISSRLSEGILIIKFPVKPLKTEEEKKQQKRQISII